MNQDNMMWVDGEQVNQDLAKLNLYRRYVPYTIKALEKAVIELKQDIEYTDSALIVELMKARVKEIEADLKLLKNDV